MQRLQAIYPDYAPEVAFYAVGVHPGIVEDLAVLENYRQERGHPWPVAVAPRQLLADLNVTIQSTKIAFDAQGTITYREGMGQGNAAAWREVFAALAAGENPG